MTVFTFYKKCRIYNIRNLTNLTDFKGELKQSPSARILMSRPSYVHVEWKPIVCYSMSGRNKHMTVVRVVNLIIYYLNIFTI